MNGSGFSRVVIVALLLLTVSINALDTMEDVGTPPPYSTLLGDEFAGGSGTAADPYRITNVDELQNMSLNLSAHYVLANDIDASATTGWYAGAGFEPVGTVLDTFNGSLDGRNYTITALSIQRPGTDNVGLFGNVNRRGSMMNVGLVDVRVTGRNTVGGLVGHNDGTVSNCLASGNVTGRRNTGGLVGYNDNNGKMFSSRATCDVAGDVRVGGLVGLNDNVVSDSHAAGNVTGNASVGGLVGGSRQGNIVSSSFTAGVVVGNGEGVGGLVGYNEWSTVERSHATVDVEGTSGGVGGLVGRNEVGKVSDSYATGNVSGEAYLGGLVGWMYNGGTVSRSYATGNVSGTDGIVGGFVGYNHYGTLEDSYAWGSVVLSNRSGTLLGGFVGFNYGHVSRCYSTGKVTYEVGADPADKGFAGGDSGTFEMTGNFWDNQTSLQTGTSGNATGKDTMEMRTRSTFADAGWDLASVWCMLEGLTYPLLRWQDTGPPTADAGPDQTVDEGAMVTFDGSGSHDDIGIADHAWTLTDGSPLSLYGVRPVYTFDDPGVFIVTLNVTDAADNWRTDTMTVTVNDVTPPTADAGPDQTVDEGTLVTLDGSGSSDNVGVVGYTWTFTDGTLVTLYGTHPTHLFDTPGTFVVTLNVTDAAGYWGVDEVTVTVRYVADPPFFQTLRLDNSTQGVPYSFFLNVTDGLWTDLMTFTLETEAGWLALNTTTLELHGTPGPHDVGVVWVNVTAEDDYGFRATGNWRLTVLNVNDPPVIVSEDLATTTEDTTYRVEYGALDPDTGDTLTWSLDTNAAWLSIDAATGVLSGLPTNDDVGTYRVNVTVTDGSSAETSREFTLTVLNANDAPVITTDSLDGAVEDVAYLSTCEAFDIDPTMDVLEWSISTDAAFLTIDRGTGTLSGTPTNDDVGEWTVNVSVSDGNGGIAWAELGLTVANVNDLPVISGLLPANGTEYKKGMAIVFSVNATDEDGDELTITWRADGKVLGTGSPFEYSKLGKDEHTVTVTVDDGTGTVEASTTVWVREEKDINGTGIIPSLLIIAILVLVISTVIWYRQRRGAGSSP